MMELPRLYGFGKPNHMASALDVRFEFKRGIGVQIVNRGEMKEVIDLILEGFDVLGARPQDRAS